MEAYNVQSILVLYNVGAEELGTVMSSFEGTRRGYRLWGKSVSKVVVGV